MDNSDPKDLPPGERLLKSEILKLESQLLADKTPHRALQQRLKHLLRIPDNVYSDMLESVRDVTRANHKVQRQNVKRNSELEKSLERARYQKQRYLEKGQREKLRGKSRLYRWCSNGSRRIVAYFKFFWELSTLSVLAKISVASAALLFWHYALYLHLGLTVVISVLEFSINSQMSTSIGPGSQELLGASQGMGIAACVGYWIVFLLGWTSARTRSRKLGLVYIILVIVVTLFYLVFTLTEDYDEKAETLGLTLAPKMREFLSDPRKFSYIGQMQMRFACCGGSSPMDYVEHNDDYTAFKEVRLPRSCCLRSTSPSSLKNSVSCGITKRQPPPFHLNSAGCGKAVADYLIPTQSIKYPLCWALVYLCVLSVTSSTLFFKCYKVEVVGRDVTEAKLTLGEKLLAALDIHKLDEGDNTDAAVDVLRHRIGECETIPEVIHTVMEMIEEVEDLLFVDPHYLAKLIFGVKYPNLDVSAPAMPSDGVSPSVPYLADPRLELMTSSLLSTGKTAQTDLLREELSHQSVQYSPVYVLPNDDTVTVVPTPELEEDKGSVHFKPNIPNKRNKVMPSIVPTKDILRCLKNLRLYHRPGPTTVTPPPPHKEDDHDILPSSRKRSSESKTSGEFSLTRVPPHQPPRGYRAGRQETYRERLERLLGDVIQQSQLSVRNMRSSARYMHPLAFRSPETHQLLPHATRLLQTVDDIKHQRSAEPHQHHPRHHHHHHQKVISPSESETSIASSSQPATSSSAGVHLSRVSGKVMTASQYDLDAMESADAMELIREFLPQHLEQSPGRLDIGLRNWVANIKDDH